MASTSSSAAAARAASQRRIEEEEMTDYSRTDLNTDWEFKIVRSITGAFRNPAALQKLQQEEAQAGWVMVEKFDEARVRFKRPMGARDNDSRLPQGVDPYRSYFGVRYTSFILLVVVIAVGAVGLVTFCAIIVPLLTIGQSMR
jgi:hypothetical protein